jgi:hypothetical protein
MHRAKRSTNIVVCGRAASKSRGIIGHVDGQVECRKVVRTIEPRLTAEWPTDKHLASTILVERRERRKRAPPSVVGVPELSACENCEQPRLVMLVDLVDGFINRETEMLI